jgi:hypothetical protein
MAALSSLSALLEVSLLLLSARAAAAAAYAADDIW